MRQEEIEMAIAVVVVEGSAHGVERGVHHPAHRRDVDEPALLAQPVLEQVDRPALDGADEQVEISVAVDVAERGAAAPMDEVEANGDGNLGIGSIALVLVEVVGCRVAAHHVEIDIAVAVVVRRGNAAAEELWIGHQGQRPAAERAFVQSGFIVADKGDVGRFGIRRDGNGASRVWRRRDATATTSAAAGTQQSQRQRRPEGGFHDSACSNWRVGATLVVARLRPIRAPARPRGRDRECCRILVPWDRRCDMLRAGTSPPLRAMAHLMFHSAASLARFSHQGPR